jgi:hypothetical protein
MKKLYFSFFTVFTGVSLNAQLTQNNHAPFNGDKYVMYRCDSINTNPGASGANALWNFSTISTFSNLVRSYTATTLTSPSFPGADKAVSSATNDVAFYSSTTTGLKYHGGNISVGGVSGSLTYTSPAMFASYPMSLNTTTSSIIGGTVNVTSPLPTTGSFSGMSSVLVDGSGTINLPGGVTFVNVLRVVTSQTINITTAITTLTVNQVTYEYYEIGVKPPLFSITTGSATALGTTTTQKYVARNKDAGTPASINEQNGEKFLFNVYPNPSSSFINFVTNNPEAKYVSIYDITGKLVDKQMLTGGEVKVNVSAHNKGIYLYTISSEENRTLKSGKITVTQ